LARTSKGDVYSWGKNDVGQLGLGKKNVEKISTPTKISTLPKVKRIFSGWNHSFALEFAKGLSFYILV